MGTDPQPALMPATAAVSATPPETVRNQLAQIGLGFLSKRVAVLAAAGGGTGLMTWLGKIPPTLYPQIVSAAESVIVVALLCWTGERIVELLTAKR